MASELSSLIEDELHKAGVSTDRGARGQRAGSYAPFDIEGARLRAGGALSRCLGGGTVKVKHIAAMLVALAIFVAFMAAVLSHNNYATSEPGPTAGPSQGLGGGPPPATPLLPPPPDAPGSGGESPG
eukprot:CAMPEP_0182866294 /NCGR_PEP_ID=MMETSP0034_2-20130328/8133_1 /TAXON_ID=156128 /ORGANISM="Nephroselmis pyriformis, Strain CCMP717" /LENGTH=126 /DNA_ID=CAMNT_0024998621 /DNA_START=112 /DNA_END=489 /DNA_ORIENTATION=+